MSVPLKCSRSAHFDLLEAVHVVSKCRKRQISLSSWANGPLNGFLEKRGEVLRGKFAKDHHSENGWDGSKILTPFINADNVNKVIQKATRRTSDKTSRSSLELCPCALVSQVTQRKLMLINSYQLKFLKYLHDWVKNMYRSIFDSPRMLWYDDAARLTHMSCRLPNADRIKQ